MEDINIKVVTLEFKDLTRESQLGVLVELFDKVTENLKLAWGHHYPGNMNELMLYDKLRKELKRREND